MTKLTYKRWKPGERAIHAKYGPGVILPEKYWDYMDGDPANLYYGFTPDTPPPEDDDRYKGYPHVWATPFELEPIDSNYSTYKFKMSAAISGTILVRGANVEHAKDRAYEERANHREWQEQKTDYIVVSDATEIIL